MTYDRELADRIRSELDGYEHTEKAMFGGLTFLINGNMSVTASGKGGLMVRVEPEMTQALLNEPGAAEVQMGKRGPTNGWLRISADVLDDDAVLTTWVGRGVDYAASLPPKMSPPKTAPPKT